MSNHHVAGASQLCQTQGVGSIQCQRFFAKNLLAGRDGFLDRFSVQVWWQTDVNAVDVGIGGSSSVLSRLRSRKTAMNAIADESADSSHDDASYELELSVTTGSGGGVGEYNREEKLGLERDTANVGDPQTEVLEPMNITKVLTELQAIQSQGPKKYCILGTRHCSFLHQQIVEML